MSRPDIDKVFRCRDAARYLEAAGKIVVDGDDLRRQVEELHGKRTAGRLASKSATLGGESLRRAWARDQAVRSRLTGILMQLDDTLGRIEEMRTAAVVRMLSLHDDMIPVKNVTDKRTFLVAGLDARVPWLAGAVRAREAARYVVQDIDKAAWALRGIKDTYDLDTRPENEL